MRYNKQELFALASQTSQNFDREGVLILKERQDSFFRRSEGYSARWFRLRGNLLFYLKGPEPWYEPLGLIILGNHQVSVQNQDENGHWPFQLGWENGACFRLGTFLESERTLWLKAMASPYEELTQRMADLQQQLKDTRTMIDLKKYRVMNKIINGFNQLPFCELSLSCDNLLCDAYGTAPSPFAVVYVLFSKEDVCVRYGCTEVVQKCSNPNFLRTIMFRTCDGVEGDMMIRILVYDMREMVTQTGVLIGSVTMRLSHIQEAQRIRVPLMTIENKIVGFITFNGWTLVPANSATSPTHILNPEKNSRELTPKLPAHRRSQSLPLRLGLKLQYPVYPQLITENFLDPHQATYHFHSGLGGDIIVQESMGEPSFCFTMPLQLLQIFITREQEHQDIMMAFEAKEHVALHMNAIKELEAVRDKMLSHSVFFKPSVGKVSEIAAVPELAYVPINLHIQRLWAHNDSLNKKGFYDTITVGAFSAHSHTTDKPGGLIRLLQLSKDASTRKVEMTANSNRLEAEYEKLRTMGNLQKMLITHMDTALNLLSNGILTHVRNYMAGIRENLKLILEMWNLEQTAEALFKVGWNKKKIDTEDVERRLADNLALQARLTEPGGIAHRSACAAAAIAVVASLSVPTIADRAVVTTSIEAVVNGADRVRTAAGAAAGGPVRVSPILLKTFDGEKADAKLANLTSTDVVKTATANKYQVAALASLESRKKTPAFGRTRSEYNLRTLFGHISANPTLAASRSLSESDLHNTSAPNVKNNQSPRNDCGKNGNNSEHGAEGTSTSGVNAARTSGDGAPAEVTRTSGVNAAGTSDESAPEEVDSNIASSAAATSEKQAAAISKIINLEQATSSSGLSAAGTSGSTASVQNASKPHTSGKGNRGKQRGCKHNRAPKLTKQARKEANRESLRLTAGGQAQMDETVQFERLVNRRGNFASSDQVTLGNLLFNKIGNTKKTKKNRREPAVARPDPAEVRQYNHNFFSSLNESLNEIIHKLFVKINTILLKGNYTATEFEETRIMMDLTIKLLEEIQKWARLAHTAMRIDTEPPAWTIEYTRLRTRRDICFSQALTAAAAGVLAWATTTPGEIVVKIVQSGLGPLLEFEGLLTMYADEVTMWGDMVIAVEDLQTLTFKFVTVAPSAPVVPQVTGSRNALIIEIPIMNSLYAMFDSTAVSPTFTATAVFFNMGINDKVYWAETFGDTEPQYQSNKDNFNRLFNYYEKYCHQFPQDPFEQFRASSRGKPLEEAMENLRSAVIRSDPKDVEILQLASLATRLMHGVRFTSCKSAKDRTGMSVTLEQVNILSNEYHLADDERKLALDVMRSEGCRRENTLKNVGQRKFAFTKQQVMALPEEYRPPLGSYGVIDGVLRADRD